MPDYNIFDMSKEKLLDLYSSIKRGQHTDWWPSDATFRSSIVWLNREQEGANFRFKYVGAYADGGDYVTTSASTIGLKLQADPASRPCFIKLPLTIRIPDNIGGYRSVATECIIFASAAGVGTGFPAITWFTGNTYVANTLHRDGQTTYTEHNFTFNQSPRTQWISNNGTEISDLVYWKLSGDGTGGITHRYWTTSEKNTISTRLSQICSRITYGTAGYLNITTDYPYWESQYSSTFNGHGLFRYQTGGMVAYDALPFPLFDISQVDDIVRYINTGDRSGEIQPFDTENPEEVLVENYNSNHTLYISNSETNKNYVHFSLQGYNADFFNNIDTLKGSYAEYAWDWTTGAGSTIKKIDQSYQQNPVVSWNAYKLTSGYTHSYLFYFADYPETFNPATETSEKASGGWIVNLSYKASSEYKLQIASVKWINLNTGAETSVSKETITDGYRYVHGSEHLDILFRAIGIKDLGDIADDGYINDSDDEDDSHGSDQTFPVGNGFGTYYITSTAFDTINETLWYGQWSLTDKADPIQAILSCKSIPFDNTSGTPSDVYLASKNTDVTAPKVNPVKSYTFANLKIGPFRGDFSDIYYTRVHIFLPFIGWKDLPASEVVTRAGRPDVGITGVTKTLGFKYLVDFISGDCRCIITINGTERYYFDGNCGADIPMTSNNHSIAESRAALGAVGTAISVVGTVASAATGNFVAAGVGALSAISSLSSAIPQYSYTASASPSGYIEASMNRNIMVVVEKPIVQEPQSYAHKVGKPCMRNLTLGTLRGYTKCLNADTSSINCTDEEHRILEDLLNTGVYL